MSDCTESEDEDKEAVGGERLERDAGRPDPSGQGIHPPERIECGHPRVNTDRHPRTAEQQATDGHPGERPDGAEEMIRAGEDDAAVTRREAGQRRDKNAGPGTLCRGQEGWPNADRCRERRMAIGMHGRVRTNEPAQGQWLIAGSLV